MKSLFIDTASNKRIVTVLKDNKIVKENIEDNGLDLSSKMVPLLASTMESANMLPKEIDDIFVVVGPGSFTGIRIGVTIAKTYAWSLKKKIIPLSELETYASGNYELSFNNITKSDENKCYIIPYINARRDYIYGGIYTKDLDIYMSDTHILVEDLLDRIPSHSNVVFVSFDEEPINMDRLKELDKRGINYIIASPKFDIEKLIIKHMNDKGVNSHECNPNYLKDTEAEENLHKKA
jgi:tRNA threonylcarbamoyladenosine biosynthesis protein TsaB